MAAQFALGTYRMTDLDPEHIQAIRLAIESGVTLIDTSTNYMDGGAERAIAQALHTLSDETVCEVEILSKFGYIQGSMMARFKEGACFKNVVEYASHVYHCIDIEFMKSQLSESLERLNRESLGCYLLHNPEYYLLDAINRGVDRAERLDEMLQRIGDVFVGLEQEVQRGRIKSYGISSGSFAKAQYDEEFLPYEELIILAENAAKEVGSTHHHFTTIQLPVNLLEREGLRCAAWAKAHALRVLTERPLNAQKGKLMYRLADYDEPGEYFHHLNAMLELCDNDGLKTLYTLMGELDGNRHRFGWIGEYESFYHAQILPHLRQALVSLQEDDRHALAESLNLFFNQYAKMVAFECSKATRVQLKEELQGCEKPLQRCALEFLQRQDDIDFVLVGMRKPSYITEVMAVNL